MSVASGSRPMSAGSLYRPHSAASLTRPPSGTSLIRPASVTSMGRPKSAASINRPKSAASFERPNSAASIDLAIDRLTSAGLLEPSRSTASLRYAERNMYLLAPSATSASFQAVWSHPFYNHEDKIARLRRIDTQASLLADNIAKLALAGSKSKQPRLHRASTGHTMSIIRAGLGARPSPSSLPRGPLQPFIRSSRFLGRKKGYTFQMGRRGLGYYPDLVQQQPHKFYPMPAEPPPPSPDKPKLTHDELFHQKKELNDLMAMAETGVNSRFTDMYKAFQYVDLDRSGRLSRKELQRALELWNIPIDDAKLDLMLADCDADGDGGVSYEEFVDKLARETVAPAAMGKRGMQSLEAMGVDSQEMLAEQIGHRNHQMNTFKPSINV